MERRNILPRGTRTQNSRNTSHQRSHVSAQFDSNTQENSHLSAEILVARQLAWIGDQIELGRMSAGRSGNVPRLIGRSLAAAGDRLECRYDPFTRRTETFLRISCRGFSGLEDGGFIIAGTLFHVCYIVLQQLSRNMP